MQRRHVLPHLLALGLLGTLPPLRAAPKARRAASALLDTELAAIASDPACPLASLSVLAIAGGKISYQAQFGQRCMASGSAAALPADAHTLFRIASVSKMMTTVALMMLVEQGKLDLSADAGNYLGFPLRNPNFPEHVITLRHLLSHTASLRDEAGYSWPCHTALASILVPGQPLFGNGAMWARNAGPGEYFSYCNLNWGVIGTIMEKAGGQRFDLLMQALLLGPLEMHGGYNPAGFSSADLANLATLYRKRTVDTEVWDSGGPWIAQADDYREHPPQPPAGLEHYPVGSNATPFSPTGGLRVSAADLAKVMLMLMHGGRHEGRAVLKPATVSSMVARQWSHDGSNINGDTGAGLFQYWGLGNQQFPDHPGSRLVDTKGFAAIGHLGEAYGLMSVFAADLARKNGLIVLAGGLGANPAGNKGQYSAMPRFQEQILSLLYRHAIA